MTRNAHGKLNWVSQKGRGKSHTFEKKKKKNKEKRDVNELQINWRSFCKIDSFTSPRSVAFCQRSRCSRCLSPCFQLKTCKKKEDFQSRRRYAAIFNYCVGWFTLFVMISHLSSCNCVFSSVYLLSHSGICKTHAHYWLCASERYLNYIGLGW